MHNFEIIDGQIIVDDTYFGKDSLNEYFRSHKLKSDSYSMEEIEELIESVAFMLDKYNTDNDIKKIAEMLED